MRDDAQIINDLAQRIRVVDGQHTLGAGALAEGLLDLVREAQAEVLMDTAMRLDGRWFPAPQWDFPRALRAIARDLDPS